MFNKQKGELWTKRKKKLLVAADLKTKEEFELREKRLGFVYKLLYVLAAIWAAIFSRIYI